MTLKCFIGIKGSGKGYQCNILKKQGYIQIDFADELKAMCWDILGWTPENDKEYEDFKLGKIYIDGFGYVNGRKFLQNLGTEAIRKRDPEFWCWEWNKKVEKYFYNTNICCSDLRFLNELKMARYFDAEFYFVNYKSERYDCTDTHESERLAQFLLAHNFAHMQRITQPNIEYVINNFEAWSNEYDRMLKLDKENGTNYLQEFRGF
jgi:hypothetical protein